MVDTPAKVLNMRWNTSGDVELVLDGDNAMVEMTQVDATSQLGQMVILDENAVAFTFDLSVASAGAGDTLEVLFDNEALGTLDLTMLSAQQKILVSLSDHAGDFGVISFRLAGPLETPSVVRLDNLNNLNVTLNGKIANGPSSTI